LAIPSVLLRRARWLLPLLLAGCADPPTVTVYSALDSEFSEPVLDDFQRETGIRVRTRFDTESTKTVGLVQTILAEVDAGHPRCDVFWNNEILNTLRLADRGHLDVYFSPAHRDYPDAFRAADGTWHGFAGRARVLIVNTDRVARDRMPASIHDLSAQRWRGQVGIAKPLFGTTATHAACLFAVWGDEQAKAFFRALKQNDVAIESGNKQVALRVASGRLAFGLTDTDDAMIEKSKGMPVEIVYPDSVPGELGTLLIPNTLAVIKGCQHPDEARRLVDHLLTPEVEQRLAEGPSAQIPLNPKVTADIQVKTPAELQTMQVDFREAAAKWDVTAEFLRDEFLAP